METQVVNLFNQEVLPTSKKEYSFLIEPSQEICQEVTQYKTLVGNIIGDYTDRHFKPHISIIKFYFDEHKEQQLIKRMDNHLCYIPSFEVMTRNFGKFENKTSTFYIDVDNKDRIVYLQKIIINLISRLVPARERRYNQPNPHITIANGLEPNQLNHVERIFADQTYQRRFPINSVTLLKRVDGKYRKVAGILLHTPGGRGSYWN